MQFHQIAVQPFPIGLLGRIFFFDLLILENFSLPRIHQKHFPGMETFLQYDIFFRNLQHADFGSQNHISVFHHIVSGWPQTVPVQNGAHQLTV